MRRFEFALLFAEVFAVAWAAVFGVRTRRGIVALVLTATFIVHWRVEGLRWQMIPLYGVALGLVIGDIILLERTIPWTRRLARVVFGLSGLALAALPSLVLPVPVLPVPSGPSAVGTFTAVLVDTERVETYGPAPGGPRRLNVQVWYPADSSSGGSSPGAWADDWDVVAPAMARNLGFPSWFLNHTKYVDANAIPDAPVISGRFPIVIYSHGWTGFRTIAINQMEMLASNGFIVIAPDHTYGAIATRFPNGDVAEHDPAALPEEEVVGEAAYEAASETLVATFAGDLITILNALEEESGGVFARIIDSADLTRVGVYGHSTGGGAAVQVCLEDERCDAVLGMDAWVEPLPDQVLRQSLQRPSLFMRSDERRGNENDAILRGIAGRSEEPVFWIGIEGAGHNDFVVTPLISPAAERLGLKGPIPAGRIIPILDRYLLGFFDVFLLETGSAALDTASYPEVSVEVFTPEE